MNQHDWAPIEDSLLSISAKTAVPQATLTAKMQNIAMDRGLFKKRLTANLFIDLKLFVSCIDPLYLIWKPGFGYCMTQIRCPDSSS